MPPSAVWHECWMLRPVNTAVIPAKAGIQSCRHVRVGGHPGVVPAKAGTQALSGIARLARDLRSYLRVAPPLHPGWLSFVRQKESHERKGLPEPPTASCASRPPRRSPNSPGAKYAPRARSKVSRKPRGGLRCSAAATGLEKTKLATLCFCVLYEQSS